MGRGALSDTVSKLDALAGANGGFVANSQTNSGAAGGAPSGTVTLEVPVASFSTVLGEAQSLGTVSNLTTQATDVTAQYVDLQSQITALEASRQQYLTIMTKAASIGDVLAVQAQLDTLQTQIQQLQGQLAVLASETDYSKITVVVSEPGAPHHHHGRRRRIGPGPGLARQCPRLRRRSRGAHPDCRTGSVRAALPGRRPPRGSAPLAAPPTTQSLNERSDRHYPVS